MEGPRYPTRASSEQGDSCRGRANVQVGLCLVANICDVQRPAFEIVDSSPDFAAPNLGIRSLSHAVHGETDV